jgi:hypothetical protein
VRWLCSGTGGSGRHAGFLLHIWNPGTDHREVGPELGLENADSCLEPFNLSDALRVWDDEEHRRAFITWSKRRS